MSLQRWQRLGREDHGLEQRQCTASSWSIRDGMQGSASVAVLQTAWSLGLLRVSAFCSLCCSLQLPSRFLSPHTCYASLSVSLFSWARFTSLALMFGSGVTLAPASWKTKASSNRKVPHLPFFKLQGWYNRKSIASREGSPWIMNVNRIGEDWPSHRQINKWLQRDK